MKIQKTSNNKQKIIISKSEWESIGKKNGWIGKTAQVNNRQVAMLEWYNFCTGQNLPLDANGYEQAGRSDGIIRAIASDPNAFHKFVSRQGNYTPVSLVEDVFKSISR
jgi:hypothetical protein